MINRFISFPSGAEAYLNVQGDRSDDVGMGLGPVGRGAEAGWRLKCAAPAEGSGELMGVRVGMAQGIDAGVRRGCVGEGVGMASVRRLG